MPKAPKIIRNPVFNDFIYSILYQATAQEKRGLRGRLMKAAVRSGDAKNFAANASFEEKEELLAHFGIEHFTVFVKTNTYGISKLKEILTKFQEDKQSGAIKEMVDAKVFVTSDKQFIQLLRLMSMSIHKPTYFLNQEFARVGYHVSKWNKRNLNRQDMAVWEAREAADLLVRYWHSTIVKAMYMKGSTGMRPFHMLILSYFFHFANHYLNQSKIMDRFFGAKTVTEIRAGLRELEKRQFIQKNALNSEEFTITTLGIQQVYNFTDEVINGANDF